MAALRQSNSQPTSLKPKRPKDYRPHRAQIDSGERAGQSRISNRTIDKYLESPLRSGLPSVHHHSRVRPFRKPAACPTSLRRRHHHHHYGRTKPYRPNPCRTNYIYTCPHIGDTSRQHLTRLDSTRIVGHCPALQLTRTTLPHIRCATTGKAGASQSDALNLEYPFFLFFATRLIKVQPPFAVTSLETDDDRAAFLIGLIVRIRSKARNYQP